MIVTICGSVRLGREVWDKVAEELTFKGYLVFIVNVWEQHERLHTIGGLADKTTLDIVHKIKIAKSDLVYVLWDGDHLGESTRSEIEHAEKLNKPLMFINVATGKYSELKEESEPRSMEETTNE